MDYRLARLLTAPGQRAQEALRLPAVARRPALALVGLGCGLSPAFLGYFGISVWGPIGLGLIVAALGLLLGRRALPNGLAAVAVLGLLLLAIWSLLSMGWAESADRALTEGDRWALYAVFLLLMVLLVSDRRDGEVLLLSTVVAVLAIAGYDLARMLAGDGSSLFGGSRLLEPLGYVNGMGGFFLLGFWPLIAAAERIRRHWLVGLAAGAATLLAALVLMTESRGTLFAFAASAVVVLALLPGRGRRAWLLLAVLAGLGVAWGALADVTQALPPGQFAPGEEVIRRGAEWSLLVAAGVAVLSGVGSWAVASLGERSAGLSALLPRISAAGLGAIAVVAVLAAAVTVGDPVGRVSDQYNAFTELKPAGSGSRFTSGGGNRYDYWRIAWKQFSDHPLDGVGAGNFDRTYFLERRTNEDVRQAHSIELQTVGETGLVGAAALAAFLVAVFVGLWRRARAAGSRGTETSLTVAAGGTFVVWLAQTSVDWLHLIPGLTGIALGAAAILLLPPEPRERGAGLGPLAPAGMLAVLVLAAAGVVFIGRPTLAERLQAQAGEELVADPRAALGKVGESLSLNPDAVEAYYTEAAAFARLDAYRPAREALVEAIRREPHNYVSWALLGDLETRRGKLAAARRAYLEASKLNPRDRGLRLQAAAE